jgi:hypothetical protein
MTNNSNSMGITAPTHPLNESNFISDGGFMQVGEKHEAAEAKKCNCDANNPNPKPIDPRKLCQKGCDYYRLREEDYKSRHTCAGCKSHPLPRYYLGYGLKYCEKFTKVTYGKLSAKGKAWLLKTRCLLQERLEAALEEDPTIELNDEAFTNAAFEMHSQAYLDAGLSDLPAGDLWEIMWTPEKSEWLIGATWRQAGQVTPSVAHGVGRQYIKPGIIIWDYIEPDPAY